MLSKSLAWAVHFYTALGLVAAAFSAVCIVLGGEENFRIAILFLFAAMVIDATDGYFARRVRVQEVLPLFDGRRLDDLIDFHTYTTIPLLLIWQSEIMPPDRAWVLLFPLLASAYGFSQKNAKTIDGYFLGFPSYWNVIAFYLYYLKPAEWVSMTVIVAFSVLTFVPSKYLHPSIPGPLSRISTVLGAFWALIVFSIIIGVTDEYPWLVLSLAYPLYYIAASWIITIKEWNQL